MLIDVPHGKHLHRESAVLGRTSIGRRRLVRVRFDHEYNAPTSSPRRSRPTRWRRTTKRTESSEQPEPGAADASCGGSGTRRQARGPAAELQFRMPLCVIFGAPLRIGQDREGLIDVLKLQSRTGRGVAIRMVAPRMSEKPRSPPPRLPKDRSPAQHIGRVVHEHRAPCTSRFSYRKGA
jgi:hypothetical protein